MNGDDGRAIENTDLFAQVLADGRSVFSGAPWSDIEVDDITAEGRLMIATIERHPARSRPSSSEET